MALSCFNEPSEGIFFPEGLKGFAFIFLLFFPVFVFLHKSSPSHWSSTELSSKHLKSITSFFLTKCQTKQMLKTFTCELMFW